MGFILEGLLAGQCMNGFPCQTDHAGSGEASWTEAWTGLRKLLYASRKDERAPGLGESLWARTSPISLIKLQHGSVYSSLPLLDCQSFECRNWNLLISGALVLPGDETLSKGLVVPFEGQNSLITKMISFCWVPHRQTPAATPPRCL